MLKRLLIAISLLLCSWSEVRAEDPPGKKGERPKPYFRGERGQAPGPGGMRPGGGPGPGGDAIRPIERYLENLKKDHPAEYEAMIKLQHENPEAFRQQLLNRLNNMRRAMENIGPDQRDEVRRRFMERRGSGGGFRPNGSPEEIEAMRKKHESFKRDIASLRTRYHEATDPAKRDQVRAKITTKVTEMFQSRQSERRKHIEKIRKELQQMEAKMAEDEGKREQHITSRVADILNK